MTQWLEQLKNALVAQGVTLASEQPALNPGEQLLVVALASGSNLLANVQTGMIAVLRPDGAIVGSIAINQKLTGISCDQAISRIALLIAQAVSLNAEML